MTGTSCHQTPTMLLLRKRSTWIREKEKQRWGSPALWNHPESTAGRLARIRTDFQTSTPAAYGMPKITPAHMMWYSWHFMGCTAFPPPPGALVGEENLQTGTGPLETSSMSSSALLHKGNPPRTRPLKCFQLIGTLSVRVSGSLTHRPLARAQCSLQLSGYWRYCGANLHQYQASIKTSSVLVAPPKKATRGFHCPFSVNLFPSNPFFAPATHNPSHCRSRSPDLLKGTPQSRTLHTDCATSARPRGYPQHSVSQNEHGHGSS